MIKYLMLWYRARTYCPVIDSLRSEPEAWLTWSAYRSYKNKDWKAKHKYDNPPSWGGTHSSLYHKDLDIEITYWDYTSYYKEAFRGGHKLPVCKNRIKRALKHRAAYFEAKRVTAALAELNRVTQDAQTLRLARIVQLRKELAQQEAADFAHRLEHDT